MINYFFLYGLVVVVAFWAIISVGRNSPKYVYLVMGIALFLFAAFRGENVDRDYENYILLYENSYDLNLLLTEPSFIFLSWLVKISYNNVLGLFILYAFIGIAVKFYAVKQLSEFYLLSAIIYLSTFFLLHEMTQIRGGVASGFLLLCVRPICEKKIGPFLFFALMACLFHYSSIVILPLYFLGSSNVNVKLYIGLIMAVYILHFRGIHLASLFGNLPFNNLQYKVEANKEVMTINDDKIQVFNVLQIIRLLFSFFFLWKINLLKEANKYSTILLKIYILSICAMVILADIPTFAVRISEFLGVVEIILLPFIVYIIQPPKIAAVLVALISIFFLTTNLFYTKLIVFK